jgi:NAD+ kinase
MRVAIYGKGIIADKKEYIDTLFQHLKKHSIEYVVFDKYAERIDYHLKNIELNSTFSNHKDLITSNIDLLLSIGGDGTLLDTVNLIQDSNIPVFGINLGRMGFLSNCPKEQIKESINLIANNAYEIEKRSLLCAANSETNIGETTYALNEFSINKNPYTTMINIKVWVDEFFLNTYWADGLLIATPTGSTAYSLSCNGPILTPGSENFIITPIASHNLTVRPIVISDSSTIKIEVNGDKHPFLAALDSNSKTFRKATKFSLKKAHFSFNLVKLKDQNFFETIREKLMWGSDIRN